MNLKSLALFVMTASVCVWSTASFATHAYRGMNCKSKTHTWDYRGNYPVGGDYGISKNASDVSLKALPLIDEGDDSKKNTLDDADVIYSETSSAQIGKTKKSSDCDFDYEEWKTKKTITIDLISDKDALSLNLKKGSTVEFICEESTSYPNGKECQ